MSEEVKLEALWLDWLKGEKTFTAKEVEDLLEKVKQFNAGAIDEYLTNHVDKAFNEWLNERA